MSKSLKELEAQLEKIKNEITEKKKRNNNRKNELIAKAVSQAIKEGIFLKEDYDNILNRYVKRDPDRELLKLEPIVNEPKTSKNAESSSEKNNDSDDTDTDNSDDNDTHDNAEANHGHQHNW